MPSRPHCGPRFPPTARRRLARALGRLALSLALSGAALPATMAAEPAGDDVVSASQERIEAAYLHKFLNYVDWPAASLPQPDSPYVIGVAGSDAVATELARIAAGRSVNNRGVVVKRLLPGDKVTDLHVLFIGPGEPAHRLQWLHEAKGRPILTVTGADGVLAKGGIINFHNVEHRVRFDVSVDAAEQNGIRLNSRLFSVATNVVKGNR
jgi:hypothetical protein